LKGNLLDTSVVLIAMVRPENLSVAVREAVETGPNVLSTITYWEVLLKAMKGKLGEVGDPRVWWNTAVSDFAAMPLPVRPEHIAEVYELPPIHLDPFDRVLISQARVEDLTLLTTDQDIYRYAGNRLRVIR
jgi:PIN domain nuclease of toxin-antitoxin system